MLPYTGYLFNGVRRQGYEMQLC